MASFDSEAVKAEFNQYWYSQRTIDTLLSEATHHATRCAFLSTPSLYFALGKETVTAETVDDEDKKAEHARAVALRKNSKLFEFDRQWSSDPGFVFYDFQKPEQVPIQYMDYFDYVIVDPPFITKEVWAKYMETIKLIIKKDPALSTTDVGTGNVRDCLDGGKVLFTTVLENHTMLEGLINGPLFIPRFRPYVCHLVYQYVCFLNYDATRLQSANPEVPEDDKESRKLWSAIGMANDIRHSETAFALQMEQRDREGEVLLPTLAHEKDCLLGDELGKEREAEKDLSNAPISEMRWGYVPEGWTMYLEGNEPGDAAGSAAAGAATQEDPAAYGEGYVAALALRDALDDFKGRIDRMQKLLDVQMKQRHQRVALSKALQQLKGPVPEGGAPASAEALAEAEKAIAVVSGNIDASIAARTAHLDGMAELAESIVDREKTFAKLTKGPGEADSIELAYEAAMADCIAAYRAVEVKKVPLQELAADATRKFKSPVFSRMKELLQIMKDVKKQHRAAAEEGAAPATVTAA